MKLNTTYGTIQYQYMANLYRNLSVILILIIGNVALYGQNNDCNIPQISQKEALRALYNATGGPNWKNERDAVNPWDDAQNIENWHGVYLTGNGNVYMLDLSENDLEGVLPIEIAALTNLQVLKLGGNKLRGSLGEGCLFPRFIEDLDLSNNYYTATAFEASNINDDNVFRHIYAPQREDRPSDVMIIKNVTEAEVLHLDGPLQTPRNIRYTGLEWSFRNEFQTQFYRVSGGNRHTINFVRKRNQGTYRLTMQSVKFPLLPIRWDFYLNVEEIEPSPNILCISGEFRGFRNENDNNVTDATLNLNIGMHDNSAFDIESINVVDAYLLDEDDLDNTSGDIGVHGVHELYENLLHLNEFLEANNGNTTQNTYGYESFCLFEPGLICTSDLWVTLFLNLRIQTANEAITIKGVEVKGRAIANGDSYKIVYDCEVPVVPPVVPEVLILCLDAYEDYPRVANLFPQGANVSWYRTETGGTALNNSEQVSATANDTFYWWDDSSDAISSRTPVSVRTFESPDGYSEELFNIYETPRAQVKDIYIENDGATYWYSVSSGGTPLDANTTVVNGNTYYAASCRGCECRFPVTVELGVMPPTGDPVQVLCTTSTLDDIVLEVEPGLTVVWYNGSTGGQVLNAETVIQPNTSYYAAQRDPRNGAESKTRFQVRVFANFVEPPLITNPIQKFYADESQTVGDLIAFGNEIVWYAVPTGGEQLNPAASLVNDRFYYAAQVIDGCYSARERIYVTLSPEIGDPLFGCELFKPELLKPYVIEAWVNEREVTANTTRTISFNNSTESSLFVGLLNHLKNRLLSKNVDTDLYDFPEEYEPEFIGGEPELDFRLLMPFIEGLSFRDKKFKVYGFKAIKDGYTGVSGQGRTIGFSFYLNSTKDKEFRYLTPTFTHRYKVLNAQETETVFREKTYHYPLLDDNDSTAEELLNFTNVLVNNGEFIIYASFNQNTAPARQENQVIRLPTRNVIKETVDFNSYTEDEYQPKITYDKAQIEISFVDENGNPIPNSVLQFSPQGPIIDKWQKITGQFQIPNETGRMTIALKNTDENKMVYFDDVRIQPLESNMKTFVYHPENQRLVSELDENNYATYYEYDLEGGLVRVKKETVKGVYTIQETRSGNVKK